MVITSWTSAAHTQSLASQIVRSHIFWSRLPASYKSLSQNLPPIPVQNFTKRLKSHPLTFSHEIPSIFTLMSLFLRTMWAPSLHNSKPCKTFCLSPISHHVHSLFHAIKSRPDAAQNVLPICALRRSNLTCPTAGAHQTGSRCQPDDRPYELSRCTVLSRSEPRKHRTPTPRTSKYRALEVTRTPTSSFPLSYIPSQTVAPRSILKASSSSDCSSPSQSLGL